MSLVADDFAITGAYSHTHAHMNAHCANRPATQPMSSTSQIEKELKHFNWYQFVGDVIYCDYFAELLPIKSLFMIYAQRSTDQ